MSIIPGQPECPASDFVTDGGHHRFTDWSLYVLAHEAFANYRADGSSDKLRSDLLIAARCCKACGVIETRD